MHIYTFLYLCQIYSKHPKRQRELLLLAHDMIANFLLQNGASKSDFRM